MSSPAIKDLTQYYVSLLRPIFAGRKYIYVAEVDAIVMRAENEMATLGVEDMLFLVGNKGTSTGLIPSDLRVYSLNTTGINMVKATQQFEHAVTNLPNEVERQIDEWDPNRTGRWITPALLREFEFIAGRKKYGRRKPSWLAFEDKTLIDSFWKSLGVNHPSSQVINLCDPHIKTVNHSLDKGDGTVWSADNRDGNHGGTIGVRRVTSEADFISVQNELKKMADKVRISSFIEGIPLSIHGINFEDTTIVFRPIELITLRYRDRCEFLWGGCSSTFDPSLTDREYMRELAFTTGRALNREVGYLGPFSIDGILSESGFVPTELNCRLSAGFSTLTNRLPNFPLAPLCWTVMEHERLDYRPKTLETALLDWADSNRFSGSRVITNTPFSSVNQLFLTRDGSEFRQVRANETPTATVTYGPSPMGGIVFFQSLLSEDRRNQPTAPEVVRAIRFADATIGTDFGPLECATLTRT